MNQRSIVAVLALLAAVLAFYGYRWFDEAQAASAARTSTFAEAEEALAKEGNRDFDKIVARLVALGADDREANVLLGRIECARQRYERALDLLLPVLDESGVEAWRAAAVASFRRQQLAAIDADAQRQLLTSALVFGERAAQSTDLPLDWFLCWQAATRLGMASAADRALEELRRHPESVEARTADLLVPLRNEGAAMPSLEAVGLLVAEWREPPVELELVQAALFLDGQQLDRALAIAASLLQTAPNQFEVRQLVATVHHVAVQVASPGAERDRHAALRDAQIQWLDANAPVDDTRRPLWLSWKQVR